MTKWVLLDINDKLLGRYYYNTKEEAIRVSQDIPECMTIMPIRLLTSFAMYKETE